MKLIPNPSLVTETLFQLLAEYMVEKPLPHLTELIYCLTRSYWDRIEPALPTEKEILLFSVGWGLEKLLLKNTQRIEPGWVDGIAYSPDFLAFTDIPGELKTTRMGSKKLLQEGLPVSWQRQILGYMHCLEVNEYELAVLHLLGNYKPPFPELQAFRVQATEQEIEDNWKWLLVRKEIYLACIEKKVVPSPKAFCDEWECENCRYAVRCEAEKYKGEEVWEGK